jgi:glycosyltransferase involved in cell wall biosynthesis
MSKIAGRPLKILIVNYEHPPVGGGGGVCTQNVAQELARKGHTVHVLTTGMDSLPHYEDEKGVKIFRVRVIGRKSLNVASNISMLTFPLTSIPKGLSLCFKYKYDIINTHFYAPTGPTGMILSLITRIPNVLYIHGADVYDPTRMPKTPAGKGILSFLLRVSARIQNYFAAAIACQSSNTQENIYRYIKTGRDIRIIPLPFRKPGHPKASKKNLGLDDKKFYLLSAGRAVKRKGYEYIVRAMPKLDKKIHLLIIGDWPEIPMLKKIAELLGVNDRVHLLGYIRDDADKFKYFTVSDLYVLSSVHEGMGIVLQEAMEFGLPVVATNHGGQVDLVKDGINGILVPPENTEALAEAITRVYKDKKLQKSFGVKNVDFIKNYYSSHIAEMYIDLFRSVMR